MTQEAHLSLEQLALSWIKSEVGIANSLQQ
uniref:Uncharacterized protein n=1 Tax=Anguilla anguilla TaxID=7936 RepID=A0A0E9UPT1_ANGAN